MNVVTRGFGLRSGMLSSMGYGRRVIEFIEQIGIYISARSRSWALDAPSRAWMRAAGTRFWTGYATGRTWVMAAADRLWRWSGLRTFYLAVTRPWSGSGTRSWSEPDDDR
jgi:hypothetical protein